MCGIAGVVNLNGRPVDRTHLEDMADLLSHRGPDGIGIFAEDNAGLAHARLSIIDLACGQQPMTNDDRSIWISFNGEIFNYLELRRELDRDALSQVFNFWFTLPPRTIFKNIFELPPGHSLIFQEGSTHIWQYWELDYPTAADPFSSSIPAKQEELLHLLCDATRIRLRADVPVAAYLSGGVGFPKSTAFVWETHSNPLP